MNPYLMLIILILVDALIAFLLVEWVCRGDTVHRNRVIIICAISRYKLANVELFGHYEVDYSDMRGYNAMYVRFWDGGYKHILPAEKYAVIAPYIREEDAYVTEP